MNYWYSNYEIEKDIFFPYVIIVNSMVDHDIVNTLVAYMDYLWSFLARH